MGTAATMSTQRDLGGRSRCVEKTGLMPPDQAGRLKRRPLLHMFMLLRLVLFAQRATFKAPSVPIIFILADVSLYAAERCLPAWSARKTRSSELPADPDSIAADHPRYVTSRFVVTARDVARACWPTRLADAGTEFPVPTRQAIGSATGVVLWYRHRSPRLAHRVREADP
jgi:hypothetical protein